MDRAKTEPAPTTFSPWDPYLDLALQRTDLLVRRAALHLRLLGYDPTDPYRGLLLSDEEVDQLLQRPPGEKPAPPPHPLLQAMEKQLRETEDRLERYGDRSASRLGRLLDRLELSAWERDVLLLALLPEVDPRYGRLLAFLQDDVTQQRPTVFLALQLLKGASTALYPARAGFLSCAPLVGHRLIRLQSPPTDPAPTLLQRAVRVDERIATYLLDGGASDRTPFPFLRQASPGAPLSELLLPEEILNALQRLLPSIDLGEVQMLLLEGTPGCGRRAAARAVATALDRPLLAISSLPTAAISPLERARLALREAYLQQGLLLWPEEETRPDLQQWNELIAEYPIPVLLSGEQFHLSARMPARTVRLRFPPPDAALRLSLWEAHLAAREQEAIDPHELALRFRLNDGQIGETVAWAQGVARRSGRTAITQDDLEEAIAAVATPTLGGLAREIEPHHTWEEIILPPDVLAHLHEFSAAIRQRDQVYESWGFDRRRPFGRGLNALFAGPSGTGKTMAAEIIAGELGLPLFKIDLSAVVSKYVGETEKHLQRIFAEAERGNAILFFDEADALFGKRSEVRDAHDRYANIEVAYLLQALEEHAGVAILATNLYGNVDDAFVRRMHYIIHFPFPEEEMRQGIWRVIFPQQAPLTADVDLPDLARRFRITGGHIRNIALGAAFLAADDGGTIAMHHLLRAARREFQKMGRVVDEADFGSPAEPSKE